VPQGRLYGLLPSPSEALPPSISTTCADRDSDRQRQPETDRQTESDTDRRTDTLAHAQEKGEENRKVRSRGARSSV